MNSDNKEPTRAMGAVSAHGFTESDQKPRLAASYARKSDEDNEGLKSQHLKNRQRAESHGYTIPESVAFHYEDDDTTGVSKRRKGFDRLLALVTSGEAEFERVYVKDRTRLGRWSDPRYGFFLSVLFEEHGVRIVFSENEQDFDYAGADSPDLIGHFIKEAVDGVVATEERTRLIKRVTEGRRYWVLRGFYPGSMTPYGIERWLADEASGTLIEKVPEGRKVSQEGCRYKLRWAEDNSREVIRLIFDLLESGSSLAAVARALNRQGLPSPGRGTWRSESVRRIARHPIYCGDLVWGRSTREGLPLESDAALLDGKESIIVRDFLPDAPIARTQWEDVQRLLDGNRERWNQRRATAPDFLLSGLVSCSDCGAGYHGHTSTKKMGRRRRYYRHCQRQGRRVGSPDCPARNRYIRSEVLETPVLQTISELLSDNRIAEITASALEERIEHISTADQERRIKELGKQLNRYEEAVRRLKRDIALADSETERRITHEEVMRFGQEADALRRQIADLGSEKERLEDLRRRQSGLADLSENLANVFRAGGVKDQMEVIATIVKGVTIDPDLTEATIAVRTL